VRSGQTATAVVALINRTSDAITIERIDTSCPCLAVTPGSFRIDSGERLALNLKFDSSTEPEFRGRLSIEVTGYAANGAAFQTRVKLEVSVGPVERVTSRREGSSHELKGRGSPYMFPCAAA